VLKRFDVLSAIAGDRTDKRAVSEEAGVSRSTTRRAGEALEEAGLVERTSGYQLTPLGQFALEESRRLWDVLDPVADEPELVDALPRAALTPELLRGAEVSTIEEGEPYGLLREFEREVTCADRIENVTETVTSVRQELLSNILAEGGVEIDVVIERETFVELARQRPQFVRDVGATDAVESHVLADPPAPGLTVLRQDGDWRVMVAVHDELGSIVGLLCNDRPAAVEWARETFADCRAAASPRSAVVADVLGDDENGDGSTGEE
jgi:predicted transcriptional regulator